MKIATWNVNSLNVRLETVLRWFEEASPDVACLQEIKCVDEKFPREELEGAGFNCAVFGQKTYNGVAILSKFPISDEVRHLPGEPERVAARGWARNGLPLPARRRDALATCAREPDVAHCDRAFARR